MAVEAVAAVPSNGGGTHTMIPCNRWTVSVSALFITSVAHQTIICTASYFGLGNNSFRVQQKSSMLNVINRVSFSIDLLPIPMAIEDDDEEEEEEDAAVELLPTSPEAPGVCVGVAI